MTAKQQQTLRWAAVPIALALSGWGFHQAVTAPLDGKLDSARFIVDSVNRYHNFDDIHAWELRKDSLDRETVTALKACIAKPVRCE